MRFPYVCLAQKAVWSLFYKSIFRPEKQRMQEILNNLVFSFLQGRCHVDLSET